MEQTAANKPILLTETEAAKILGFSPRTLQKWRVNGTGPVYCRASARAIRYRSSDLAAWIEERLRTSTSDDGAGRRRESGDATTSEKKESPGK